MNYRIQLTVILFGSPLFPALSLAEDGFRYRIQEISPAVERHLDETLRASETALAEGVFEPSAQKLLNAAGQFTKSVFNVPSLRLARAVTQRDGGDVLLAKWAIDEPFANGVVYLQDSPYLSRYEFHIEYGIFQSRDDVSTFLSNLIVWRKPPLNLLYRQSLEVVLPAENRPLSAFFVNATLSSTAMVRDFEIRAAYHDNGWLMEVIVGKAFTESFYPVPPFIPERFPPLTDLVQSWNSEKIWSEVGKPAGPHPWEDYSDRRDGILITELVRRGVTQEQFSELLRTSNPAMYEKRANVVFGALKAAGKSAALIRFVGPALATYEQIGPSATDAVDILFMYARKDCSPSFEEQALALLKKGMFLGPAFTYLGECSTSKEVLQMLDSYSSPLETEPQRSVAVQRLRGRTLDIRK